MGFTYIISVRNLLAILCLTLAALLGNMGMAWSDVDEYDAKYPPVIITEQHLQAQPELEERFNLEAGDLWFEKHNMFYKFTSDKWQNTAAKAHLHGDYVTAHRKWEASAKQGAASAQYNLGVMYETGQGVSQDYKAAEKWYKMAAEQGFANAQYELAEILYVKIDKQADPINIRSSLKEMLKWYRAAAEQGNKDAKRGIKRTRKSFMKKAINQCLYDEVDKVTGPESKEIVENYCEQKFSLKTLDWLVANHFR